MHSSEQEKARVPDVMLHRVHPAVNWTNIVDEGRKTGKSWLAQFELPHAVEGMRVYSNFPLTGHYEAIQNRKVR